MNAYEVFASVYDELMDNIPYDDWCTYIIEVLRKYGVDEGLICELGCGTGEITERLADAGYDMIGIDNSYEMLEVANEKKLDTGHESILYLMQDMREFELFGTVNAIVCVCDSINYLMELADITHVFRLANNYLESKGIFICDFKTRHYFKDVVADSTIAEDRDDVSFIWDNYYDEETRNNEYDLAVFIKNEDESFIRYEENHFQHGFYMEEVLEAAETAGLEVEAVYDAFTTDAPKEDSERLYYILRRRCAARSNP